MRARMFVVFAVVALSVLTLRGVEPQSQPPGDVSQILGVWTVNKDMSDLGVGPAGRGDSRGGYGRGGQGGGQPTEQQREEMERRLTALRDIIEAPEHLTIVQSNSMIIVTTGDGRTTRLSPTGEKVKDESTNIERRTKWEGGKLVSEIKGDAGRITETYSADPSHHELLVTVRVEASGGEQAARLFHRVYTAGAR